MTGAQLTPCVHVATDLVDDRGWIVLLLLGREALALVEYEYRLGSGLVLLRLGDWRDEFGTASVVDDLLGGLPCVIEFPMPPGVSVWRVQNRVVENGFDIWGSPVGRWSGIYGLFSHPVASFYGTDLDLAPRICPVLASDPRASQAPADIAKNPVNCRNSGESRSRIVPCAVLWGYNR